MAYRAFFALPVDNFATTTGEHTNAVYGFTSMLLRLISTERPTHIAVAFDAGSHTFRNDVYPQYKGGRAATPEEFKGQVPLIQQVLQAMRVTALEKDNYEADDILATLSTQGAEAGMQVLICSGDRDALQLVNERVTVLYPVKGVSELARMTPQAVFDKYAVTPAQYADLAALVGEGADNIPGVPKVGPKTAAKWLTQYGDLDTVLDNASEIRGVVGDNLRAHLEQVRLNRTINHLLRDMELDTSLTEMALEPIDLPQVHQLFDTLQFRSLRERLLTVAQEVGTTGELPESADSEAATPAETAADLETIAPGALGKWLTEAGAEVLSVDYHGVTVPAASDLWQVTLSRPDGRGIHLEIAELGNEDWKDLADWFANPSAPKIVHGAKGLWHQLYSRGGELAGVTIDTELAAYLCYPDSRSYALEDLTSRYLGRTLELADANGGQGAFDLGLSDDGAALSALQRAIAVGQLGEFFTAELARQGEADLLGELELPLVGLLGRMESAGIAVDRDYLSELTVHFDGQVTRAASGAYEVIGKEVNLSSPKQLQQVLFEDLQMPKTKKIKTGYTTDAAALSDLYTKTEHPFLANLLAHRDAIKLRQTVEGLGKAVAADGRIHTTFQQTIAATGRLSSTDPNLQNIPIRTEEGRRIRRVFVSGSEYETLLTADYSQIEMRIMAHLSQDEGLIEAFRTGEDLHNYVGARVFGVEPSEVTGEMRARVKAMSYGLAYGLSSFGLSKQLNVEVGEAAKLMDDYFSRFGGVRDYLTGVVRQATKDGWTATIMGRRRYLPDLSSENRQRREMAERMALNAPIQGSAADIIKVAMLNVDRELTARGLRSRMLLQVHDELVLEIAAGELEEVKDLVVKEMSGAVELSVPLDVSVGVGTDWQTAGH